MIEGGGEKAGTFLNKIFKRSAKAAMGSLHRLSDCLKKTINSLKDSRVLVGIEILEFN